MISWMTIWNILVLEEVDLYELQKQLKLNKYKLKMKKKGIHIRSQDICSCELLRKTVFTEEEELNAIREEDKEDDGH